MTPIHSMNTSFAPSPFSTASAVLSSGRDAFSQEEQSSAYLTVERIFGEKSEFKTEKWGPAYWLKDGSGYTTLEKSPVFDDDEIRDLVHYDPATGERAIMIAAANLIPPGHAKPLIIENYATSKDGTKMLIFANAVRVWREKTRGDYWLLDRASGDLKKLGGDAEPATMMFGTLSPDDQSVAYVYQHNVYVQSLSTGEITQLTHDGNQHVINGTADWVNEEEFLLRHGFRWSPDSRMIAYWQFDSTGVKEFPMVNYIESAYPKMQNIAYPKVGEMNSACRVGVVNATGGETTWIRSNPDPRNHYIPRMKWSNDSRQLYFQQLNRLQNVNQVMSSDPLTGDAKVIFTDTDEAWVDVMNEWLWIDGGDRFLWLSERDGWRHLYVVSVIDQSVTLLTPGVFDVINVAGVDEENGWVYFTASPDFATQRHLYRVSLDGCGASVKINPLDQPGTHTYQCSEGAKWAFHTYSSFGCPPVVELISLPDHEVRQVMVTNDALRAKLQQLKLGPRETFRVDIGDALSVDAWCIKPPNFDEKRKYPLFIHVYGEPAGSTVLDVWGGDNYLWHSMMAQHGYVVMSIDNRGTPMPRGRAWRKSIYRKIGVIAPVDQANATREILRTRPYLDANRVGIWGWSGGGSMTLNAMFRYPELYKTGMAIAFVANQRMYDTIYQERYMGLPDDNQEGFLDGSPITHAQGLQGNLLLVYGTGDDNCHYQNCELIVHELIKRNKYFSQVAYPNRSHSIEEGPNTRCHLYGTLTRYLLDHLPSHTISNA
jgi:dipeptidyl-peptidase-4